MESYGANCIYCTDSAGYMLPDDVTARIALLRSELRPETELGFHGHHNMGMGIANSLAAIDAGANRIDGSVAGLGAGAGNTPMEVFVAVLDRMGAEHGVDLYKIMDVAEDLIVPMMDTPVRIDRDALILGYAGVYSSFLLVRPARRQEVRPVVPRHPGRARPTQDRRRTGRHDRGRGARHGEGAHHIVADHRGFAGPARNPAGRQVPRACACASSGGAIVYARWRSMSDGGRDETAEGDAPATLEEPLALAETAMAPSAPSAPSTSERTAPGSAPGRHASSTMKSLVDPALDATIAASHAGPSAGRVDRSAPPPFGPYSKIEVLAEQGSIGLVARGYNDGFGRWELIKFLREELANDKEIVRQFKREGRVLAQLSHPNVVQVFATWEVEGRTCLAMEFLEGQPLSAYIAAQGGRLPVARARELMLEAARGLAASHEVGLLHRDLKPDNLFVTASGKGRAGGLKLIDFGLATAERGRPSMVADPSLVSGTAGGTPLYMAPELWLGREASAASDLYALGLTFWVALVGKTAVKGETLAAIRTELLDPAPFASIRDVRPDVPPALAAIVDRLLQKRSERRYASADELVAALVASAADARARAVPSSGPYRGFEPFSAAERDVFFGRERETLEILERLRREPALVLVGPAACGKSSLALAGVVPAILDGGLGGDVAFTAARIEPRVEALRGLAASGGLVLVVDQLEQLASGDAGAALAFATALAKLVESAGQQVRVVATLRAEQMDRLFAIEPLRALLGRGFHPVRPLSAADLRRAIEGPAHAAGYSFEDPAAPDALAAELAGTPAALLLVSFAMRAWWQVKDERRKLLTTAAWQEMGGVGGALVRHADSVLASLAPEERGAAERILPRLASAYGGRAHVPRSTLGDPALSGSAGERALDRLLAERVVLEVGGGVELLHDALVDSWPSLRALLVESGTDRVFRERVAAAARDWDAQGRPDGMLWADAQAARLEAWFSTTEAAFGQVELAFVEAVRRRARRRRFALRSLLAAVVLAAVVLAFVTQARVRRMSLELDKANADLASARTTTGKELRTLLRRVAELEADDAPGEALEAAQKSRELGEDPALDVVAWRASLAGLPFVVPFHSDGAALLAFTPDGARLLTASRKNGLRVYAVREADALAVPLPGRGALTALALSPDGKRVAVGDAAGSVVAVDLSGGTAPSAVASGKGAVRALAWTATGIVVGRGRSVAVGDGAPLVDDAVASTLSRDGSHVAAIGRDAKLHVIDVATRKQTLTASVPGASAVGIAPDGSRVLLGDPAGRLALLERAGKPRWVDTPGAAVQRIEASPDGQRWLTVDSAGRSTLWSPTLERIATVRTAGAEVTWDAPARVLLVTGRSHDVRAISVDSGVALGRVALGEHDALHLAVDPASQWLVASAADGAVRAWPLASSVARVDRAASSHDTACALATDGSAAACIDGETLSVSAPPDAPPRATAIPTAMRADDGKRQGLVVGHGGGDVAWLAGQLVQAQGSHWSRTALEASDVVMGANGAYVALGTDRVVVSQAATVAPRSIALLGATALAPGNDEARFLVGTRAGEVRAGEIATSQLAAPMALTPGSPVRVIAAAPEGDNLAAASADGRVAIAVGGVARLVWRAPSPVTCMVWARGSRGLVAGTRAGGVWLVDTQTRAAIPLWSARAPVTACARSANEDHFYVATRAGEILEQTLALDPVWMRKPSGNPLARAAGDMAAWRGLGVKE